MPETNRSEFEKRLESVDRATLAPIVGALFDTPNVILGDWRYEAIEGGFGHAYGVYRFHGEALVNGETRSWSAILKALGPDMGSAKATAWDYWKREALIYQHGLLDDLPEGLAAPRCLSVVDYPGQESWLWMEEIEESGDNNWSLERYAMAARHLGRFNGAYLVVKPLPNVPWLSSGQFRQRLALAEPSIADLPHLQRNPLFADMSSKESIDHGLRLWGERDQLLSVLDRLPRTLCHHDAFRRNLIARDDADRRSQTVAVDWSMLGPGVVGEELVALFQASLRFVAIDFERIAELDGLIFGGYMDGLRDAGWQGDITLARFGYAATVALTGIASQAIHWPSVAKHAAALPPGAEPPRLLSPGGEEQAAALHAHLLTLGDEAYALLDTFGNTLS